MKAICGIFGGTVNEVVLSAASGGYRRLLIDRGDDASQAVVRSLVPVSTRRDNSRGSADNRVSALLYELPVRIADPVERLEVVHREMDKLKVSHISEAHETVVAIGNLAPPFAASYFGEKMRSIPCIVSVSAHSIP